MILPQSYFVILRQYRKNGSYFPGMKHISVTRYDLNLGQSEPCVFITNIDSSQVDSTHLKKKNHSRFTSLLAFRDVALHLVLLCL